MMALMNLIEEMKVKGRAKETFEYCKGTEYRSFFNFIGLRQSIELDQRFLFVRGKEKQGGRR